MQGLEGLLGAGEAALPGAPAGLGAVLELLAGALVFLAVPFLILEVWQLWRRGDLSWVRIKGMLTSVFCLLPAWVVQALATGGLVAIAFGLGALAPWSIPTTWGTALLCLVLVDFLYYWEHRLGHEVNVLWALYHSVHHSANHYDQTIGGRISFVDFFFSPWFYAPLVLVGFEPLLVLASLGLVLAWQQWLHTELIDRLPWFDGWLNTPSNHRVHHGRNPQYLDKNYGGVLMVWDRLFGTYEPEGEAVDYGLVEKLESQHPVAVHTHSARKLWEKLKTVRSLPEAARLLLSNPPF